jgi:hypothetical protein
MANFIGMGGLIDAYALTTSYNRNRAAMTSSPRSAFVTNSANKDVILAGRLSSFHSALESAALSSSHKFGN